MMTQPTNTNCDFGKVLREAREKVGMDLRQISDLTRIQIRYIEALESERWEDVPRGVIGRGFVRLIAREIGADADMLLEKYRECREEPPLEHMAPADMESEFRVGVGERRFNLFGFMIERQLLKFLASVLGVILALTILLWIWSPWSSSEPLPVESAAAVETEGAHSLELLAVKATSLTLKVGDDEPVVVDFAPSEKRTFKVDEAELTLKEPGALRLSWDGEALKAPESATVKFPSDLESLKP
ncbi:MAG: hypothetical protein C0609_05825 [Deltaproteobacteria bacterium]|nr:MAG: hypothetical protein C0609_05825 [Deltaproteobacteria bacterium]